MSLLNGLATAQIAPTLEDEMAATQQSLLEELHTISEEGILDHNHRDSNADDASVPEQSTPQLHRLWPSTSLLRPRRFWSR